MINLALVGVGSWGKNYLKTVEKSKTAQIKYICASSSKTLNSFGKDYIKTNNYKDLLKFDDIYGVIIATPSETHFEIAKDLIQEFDLLVEKPLVEDSREAQELKRLEQKTKNRIMVGHIYLFDPAYIKARELSKKLGNIRYISYEGSNNGPVRPNTSALWDIGPHAVSLCLDTYKSDIRLVSAWAIESAESKKTYDLIFLKLKYSDGKTALLRLNWRSPYKKRELIIAGDKNIVVYNDLKKQKVIFYKNPISTSSKRVNSVQDFPDYLTGTPLENEISEFIDLIKGKKEIRSDLNFGIKVTKILSLAEQSIEAKGEEKLVK